MTLRATDAAGNVSDPSPALALTTTGSGRHAGADRSGCADLRQRDDHVGYRHVGRLDRQRRCRGLRRVPERLLDAGREHDRCHTVNLTGLTASTTYSVTVKARDAAGNVSAASAAGSLTTTTPPDTTAPSAPGTPTFANITGTGATVNWTASTDNVGVTGYDVFVNGSTTPAASTTGATTANLTGLTNGTSYTVTVKAKDAAGNVSNSSAAGSLTTLDTAAPSAPTGVTGTNITPTSATINWTASTDNVGVTGYEVFVDGASKATTTSATTVNLTGLTQGTYAVTVKAKDAAGNVSAASGAYSLVIPAAPDTTAPTAPGAPTFANVTTTSATVNWAASTDNVGVAGYQVFLNGSATPAATTTGATTVNLTGLTPSTTYSVTVKARDAAGNVSAASAAGSLTTTTPPDTQAPSAPGTPTFASITVPVQP